MFFMPFIKKYSNEDIFEILLENLIFQDYVRSGRWVGEVAQTNVRVREAVGQ